MKIFIAGATGVIGRRVTKKLVEKGHQVVGLSRSEKNDQTIKELGAEPHRADIFDLKSLYTASFECEGILHLATSIPRKVRTSPRDWKLNNKIRWEGTQNLIEAAFRNKCKLYVQQSVSFLYGNQKEPVDESTYLPHEVLSFLKSAQQMEWIIQDAIKDHRLPGIVLRLGWIYSEDDYHTDNILKMMKKGKFKGIGEDQQYWSIINADDAASAFVAAVENYEGNTGKVFNVVDDEPVKVRELINYMSEQVGSQKKPGKVPLFLAQFFLGVENVKLLQNSCQVKNDLIKKTLGWKPEYTTYREGYKAVIAKWLANNP